MRKKYRVAWGSIAPVIFILLLIIVLACMTEGRLVQSNTLKSLLTQSIGYLIGGMGMIFVMALGEIDMSMGVNVALSCVTATLLVGARGWLAVVLCSMVIGAVIGAVNGLFVALFHVQGFMVTIALQIGLRGAIKGIFLLIPGGRVAFAPDILKFNTLSIKLTILIIAVLAVIYLLEFSPFGSQLKAVGEDEVCAFMSGIPVKKVKAAAYILSGLFAGLAALFMCSRQGGITADTGSGFEMTVMLGMFLGGIPVEGGMETKVFKAVIGLPCLIIIQSGLTILGVDAGIYQFAEAVILLIVIIMTHFLKVYTKQRDEKIMARVLLEEEAKQA
jgi:ribose transport system permease protein